MAWIFKADRPLYLQIIEAIEKGIVSGEYPPESAFPSVRELAVQAGVNPNTMQKALSELENVGLLVSNRTAGRAVTGDRARIQLIKDQLSANHVGTFLGNMNALGFSPNESVTQLTNYLEKER